MKTNTLNTHLSMEGKHYSFIAISKHILESSQCNSVVEPVVVKEIGAGDFHC